MQEQHFADAISMLSRNYLNALVMREQCCGLINQIVLFSKLSCFEKQINLFCSVN